MNEQGLEVLDSSVQKTREWIVQVADLGDLSPHDAYKAIRAVLQTLRDRLPLIEAVHFSAQLPLLLRGIFFEGWNPSSVPVKMHREEFLASVRGRIVPTRFVDPERVTREVLAVVSRNLARGEVDKLRHCLPADLLCLFPQNTHATASAA
jgi:uncharacterized protein (DUF2267 family)